MSGSVQVQQVRLLILAKDVQQQKKAAQFLTRRGWPTDAVGSIKQAVEFVVKYRPDFVLVSMSHPNPNAAKLPKLLAQTFNAKCIAFGETNDPKTLQRLNTCGLEHVFHGAVSGPTFHLKIKKIILEQGLEEDFNPAQKKDQTNSGPVFKKSNHSSESSNLASDVETGSPQREQKNPLAASMPDNLASEPEPINNESYWSQAKKPVYGAGVEPEEVPYEKYKKPVYGKDEDEDEEKTSPYRKPDSPGKTVAYMPEQQAQERSGSYNPQADQHSNLAASANDKGPAYCPIPGDHSAHPSSKTPLRSSVQTASALEGHFQQDKHKGFLEASHENNLQTRPSAEGNSQLAESPLTSQITSANDNIVEKSEDTVKDQPQEDSDFDRARKKNFEELAPHIDQVMKDLHHSSENSPVEKESSTTAQSANLPTPVEAASGMDNPFQAARKEIEQSLTSEQLEDLLPRDDEVESETSTAALSSLGTGPSGSKNSDQEAMARALAPETSLDEIKAESNFQPFESSSKAEEQKIMQLARENNILAPDPEALKQENAPRQPMKQKAVAILDLDDPFINPMDSFFSPESEGIEIRTGAYYTVPPELFDQPDFALSLEGELPAQELNASNVNFREGYNPDHEMKAIATVVDDGFRDACTATEGIQPKEIKSLSKVGVITARSENRMGYILIARPEQYENDQSYLKEVKKSIENQKHLKEVELKVETNFFISIDTVEFKDWAEKHAEFLTILQHKDAQVAMAFVETKNLPIIKKSNRVENMAEVNVDSLIPDLAVNYHGYIKLDKNDKLILYIKNGRSISLKQKTRLLERNVNEIFIPMSDIEKFRRHYAESLLNLMIQKFKTTLQAEKEADQVAIADSAKKSA